MSVPDLIYEIDQRCAIDLVGGIINGERDYVSNLLSHIRRPFGYLYPESLGIAYTLPNKLEQKFGCDAIIIFRLIDGNAKVAMFESKLPRYFTAPTADWDSIYTRSKSKFYGKSHFSTQLERQNQLNGTGIVLFELFINENPNHTSSQLYNFDSKGSSCVTFKHAWCELHKSKSGSFNTKWVNSDLKSLLSEKLNLFKIVDEILKCNSGDKFTHDKYSISISYGESNILTIPILTESNSKDKLSETIEFMIENGLNYYSVIDIKNARGYFL